MCDQPKFRRGNGNSRQSADVLKQLADALGVEVSDFYGHKTDSLPINSLAEIDDAAMLMLVRTYLKSVELEARIRFLAVVQSIVEDPQSTGLSKD